MAGRTFGRAYGGQRDADGNVIQKVSQSEIQSDVLTRVDDSKSVSSKVSNDEQGRVNLRACLNMLEMLSDQKLSNEEYVWKLKAHNKDLIGFVPKAERAVDKRLDDDKTEFVATGYQSAVDLVHDLKDCIKQISGESDKYALYCKGTNAANVNVSIRDAKSKELLFSIDSSVDMQKQLMFDNKSDSESSVAPSAHKPSSKSLIDTISNDITRRCLSNDPSVMDYDFSDTSLSEKSDDTGIDFP